MNVIVKAVMYMNLEFFAVTVKISAVLEKAPNPFHRLLAQLPARAHTHKRTHTQARAHTEILNTVGKYCMLLC